VLVLSNSMPIGLPESICLHICLHFLDLVHYGKPQREYLTLIAKMTEVLGATPICNYVSRIERVCVGVSAKASVFVAFLSRRPLCGTAPPHAL
jgi:hypothetical protein